MILLDVETVDLVGTTAILSLGALCFNPEGTVQEVMKSPQYHRHIELSHQLKMGRSLNLSTVKWLNGQPKEVIANAMKSATSKVTLKDALNGLLVWMDTLSEFPGNVYVRGVDFEGVILPNAAKMTNVRLPFKFSGYNDIRTLLRDYLDTDSSYVTDEALSVEAKAAISKLTKHIAIDDCKIDAIQIIEGRRIRDARIIAKYEASKAR